MESNFQKFAFLGTGTGGPRTEKKVSHWRAKPIGESHERRDRKVVLLGDCGVAHVSQRRISCSL